MTLEKGTKIVVQLTPREASALVHMVKRFSFDDAIRLARTPPEAHDLVDAVIKLQQALSDKGSAPK